MAKKEHIVFLKAIGKTFLILENTAMASYFHPKQLQLSLYFASILFQ